MKKLLLLFLLFFTTDSYSSGIATNAASAPCTNNTLETYSGNSNLAADWQPNEIQLRWYNNNTLMNVQSSANTCVYDGALAVPSTAPTRTGYTFAGWTVRPEMDFSTLSISYPSLKRYARDLHYCWTNDGAFAGTPCYSDPHFQELEEKEWMIIFDNNGKTLYGMARCSAKAGNNYNRTWPLANASQWQESDVNNLDSASGDKKYCWCKTTGYKATTDGTLYGCSYPPAWFFFDEVNEGSPEYCRQHCARICSTYLSNYRVLDKVLLPVQNAN